MTGDGVGNPPDGGHKARRRPRAARGVQIGVHYAALRHPNRLLARIRRCAARELPIGGNCVQRQALCVVLRRGHLGEVRACHRSLEPSVRSEAPLFPNCTTLFFHAYFVRVIKGIDTSRQLIPTSAHYCNSELCSAIMSYFDLIRSNKSSI